MSPEDVDQFPEILNRECHATPTHRYCCCCYRSQHHQHQAQLEATQVTAADQAARIVELIEALEKIRACLDHLYSDKRHVVARLPDALVPFAGPLSIIDRVTRAAIGRGTGESRKCHDGPKRIP